MLSYDQAKKLFLIPTSKFMVINGINVHYSIEGSGKPIVLIHGNAASLHTWNVWTAIFIQQGFQVIRLDLPGCCLTGEDPADDYSIENSVAFLNQFLDGLKLKKFFLCGNSFGGQIAWNFSLSFPEKVEGLILVAASGYPGGQNLLGLKLAKWPLIGRLLKYLSPKFMIRKNLLASIADPKIVTDEKVDHYYHLFKTPGVRRAFFMRNNKARLSNESEIKNIKKPTLIFWGSLDRVNPLNHAIQFNHDIQNSKLVIFENAGHLLQEEVSPGIDLDYFKT